MSLLPEGYRFWIYPHYRLETPTVCVALTRSAAVVLSYFITHRGKRVFSSEIADALFDDRDDGGPITAERCPSAQILLLRQSLRAVGVDAVIDSSPGRKGYIFHGFGFCEPEIGKTISVRRSLPHTRFPKDRKQTRAVHQSEVLRTHSAQRKRRPKVSGTRNARRDQHPDVLWMDRPQYERHSDVPWIHNARYEQRERNTTPMTKQMNNAR